VEARQQQIANLARYVLPLVEAKEQKENFLRVTHQLVILLLTAIIAFSSAQYMRPISTNEERSLRMMLEYAAQKKHMDLGVTTNQLLAGLGLRHLDDMRAYQWEEALWILTRDLPG
jgi:hypothetical protein